MGLLGIILILVAVCFHLWIRRRQFYRRNSQGVEVFKSYGRSVFTNVGEKIVGFIGGLILLLGVACIIISLYQPDAPHPEKQKTSKHSGTH